MIQPEEEGVWLETKRRAPHPSVLGVLRKLSFFFSCVPAAACKL
jgi:hypothetical protein